MHLVETGLAGARLRGLAEAAGISDRMIVYHFGSKDAAVRAGLLAAAETLEGFLAEATAPRPLPVPALAERLGALAATRPLQPLLTLWIEVAAAGARGDAAAAEIGARMSRRLLGWIAGQLDSRNKGADSARLLALFHGLVVLRAAGLGEAADAAGG